MESPSKNPDKYSYKITNWQEYDNSLKKKVKLAFGLAPSCCPFGKKRFAAAIDVRKIAVGEPIYPDVIIEFCLTQIQL